ncbi:Putative two-component sensor [Olavius algarvensis associated proteobacterium Delta 3]|nr:Putative two-component sensor [Olavius algarvensis associated proteobacterium Delta 3]
MDNMMIKRLLEKVPARIILPVLLTVVLFVLTIFLLILPILEANMMAGKREFLRELTELAWSTLDFYAEQERSGALTREAAQRLAIDHLRHLRYGPELKDYFWINDMLPRIIMHPYRTDLEGQEVSNYSDPNGKRLFVECVRTVQTHGAGYVDYKWQWKDDPERIVPKISYVKGFPGWGWILGTGIYVEDVREEIAFLTRKLTVISLLILLVIVLLSAYIIWHGIGVESKKQRAEREAELRREQLFQASKLASVGTLASGVAHEINNPITSVMLNTPVVQKTWRAARPILDAYQEEAGDFAVGSMPYSQLRDRMPQLLDDIADSAKRVQSIVRDLKDFARKTPPDLNGSVDINRVVEKAVGLVNNLIRKSTLHFSLTCREDLPAVAGNAQRIEQVVINLVVNACQALPDNGCGISVSTGYDSVSRQVYVIVQDEGAGMTAETLEQIRDPFFTTKRESGGTGLGLSISDRIVQDHDGQMEFVSNPEKGTTVTLYLPAAEGPDFP